MSGQASSSKSMPAAPEVERAAGAAGWLDQALKMGRTDPQAAYMLGIAQKRMGKRSEARAAFRKIAEPDANVMLQLGLLSMSDGQLAQAEQEFTRSLELDPSSYAAGFNWMLTLLAQGKFEACLPVVKRVHGLSEDNRTLAHLALLLERCLQFGKGKPPPLPGNTANGSPDADLLLGMSSVDEERLLGMLNGLGQPDAIFPLLRTLAQARPASRAAQENFARSALLQAKKLADRCSWQAAEHILLPLATGFGDKSSSSGVGAELQLAVFNLLGCCQCMLQEFDRALHYFEQGVKLAPADPWLHQNLALAHELKGQLDQADPCWNRYFELQTNAPAPAMQDYHDALAFEGMNRLADAFSKKERWNTALTYLQRATRLRPNDVDALERLFHMYNQVKRPEDARRTLRKLQELRPNDPQLELYEIDLREVKTLEDIERMLGDIRKTLNRHPSDLRVEEKAVLLVQNVVPLIGRMWEQYTDQLQRVMDQVRRLPNYQINWSAVHDVARDLQREFQKLRRIANKCLGLVSADEHRRIIRDLMHKIDRKIEICQSLSR